MLLIAYQFGSFELILGNLSLRSSVCKLFDCTVTDAAL